MDVLCQPIIGVSRKCANHIYGGARERIHLKVILTSNRQVKYCGLKLDIHSSAYINKSSSLTLCFDINSQKHNTHLLIFMPGVSIYFIDKHKSIKTRKN